MRLQRLRQRSTDLLVELPFGLIFAILMCSMMLGSMLYNIFSHSLTAPTSPRMLSVNLAVAALCFLTPTHIRDEAVTLWCFCLFELCCGIYYPLMGELKGRLIEDGVRASVYGMLRVPLNAFVVLALSTTKEGKPPMAPLPYGEESLETDLAFRATSPRYDVHRLQWSAARGCSRGAQEPFVKGPRAGIF